jgi:hypothetical protein
MNNKKFKKKERMSQTQNQYKKNSNKEQGRNYTLIYQKTQNGHISRNV